MNGPAVVEHSLLTGYTTGSAIVDNLGDTNEWDLGVGVATIVALYLLKFSVPKVPSYSS